MKKLWYAREKSVAEKKILASLRLGLKHLFLFREGGRILVSNLTRILRMVIAIYYAEFNLRPVAYSINLMKLIGFFWFLFFKGSNHTGKLYFKL